MTTMQNNDQRKNIFITGGNGYLGSHITELCLSQNYNVYLIVRKSSDLERIKKDLDKITLIFKEEINFVEFFKSTKIEIIIHLATSYGRKGESIGKIVESNLAWPIDILTVAVNSGVSIFINADTSLSRNTNIYSLSKKQFLDWLKYYQNKIQVINLRLEYFYGAKDDNWKFINMLINKFKNNEPFIEFSSGKQLRDFIYIDDVKNAFKLIIEQSKNLPNFKEIEIGSGKPISIKEIVLLVKDLIQNKSTELRFGKLEDRPDETLKPFSDIQELKKLGWEPLFSIEEGLRKSINESLV